MVYVKRCRRSTIKCCIAGFLFFAGSSIAQSPSAMAQFSVSVTLNGVTTVPPGTCVTQTLFNQIGAVVKVTCLNNPFVSITPLIDMQFPGTFGGTFRYPLFSSFNVEGAGTNSSDLVSGGLNNADVSSFFNEENTLLGANVQSTLTNRFNRRRFNSPTSTVTDLSIYRTEPEATTDSQGLMDMIISF